MNNVIQRSFGIGGEWLYYKVYTGPKTADTILTEIIKPLTEKFLVDGLINKWFFIRYADPKHHIRVRFQVPDLNHLGPIIHELHKALQVLMEQDLVWKIQLDTYQRELERYGARTMEISESLFFYDSVAVVQFLDLIEGDEGERLRWLFGLRAIDHFLTSFGYLLESKLILMESLKTGFGKEFSMSRPLKKQLDQKYRQERNNIEAFIRFTKENEPDYEPILTLLDSKKEAVAPLVKQLLSIEAKAKLQMELNNLMGSYIHMMMNRLFKSKNRLNEMVCYDFLYRYYRTSLAIQKNNPNR